jgi:hypothetical protein
MIINIWIALGITFAFPIFMNYDAGIFFDFYSQFNAFQE